MKILTADDICNSGNEKGSLTLETMNKKGSGIANRLIKEFKGGLLGNRVKPLF